ncbi:uncharacterized protein K444DRAFT_511611, partial [Hyaloscypha bicolor E]
LVFVHGLNGHPERTWTDQDTRFFWPRDIHREIDGIRVVTFGYPAGVEWSLSRNLMGIHDHAVDLLTLLRNERDSTSSTTPLIFVCHSLGGLIVKEALISAQNDENFASIYNCTRALLFFGTPHRGA